MIVHIPINLSKPLENLGIMCCMAKIPQRIMVLAGKMEIPPPKAAVPFPASVSTPSEKPQT
jgi:hypothetical protein